MWALVRKGGMTCPRKRAPATVYSGVCRQHSSTFEDGRKLHRFGHA